MVQASGLEISISKYFYNKLGHPNKEDDSLVGIEGAEE